MSSEASDVSFAFLSILLEGMPFILLGTLLSGFIDVYLPKSALDKVLPKNRLLSIPIAGLLGLLMPVCECAVVPVIRRLVKKGLPLSTGVTYMLAAPIVNPITILSTYKAFSGQQELYMTLSRVGLGYIIALIAGFIIFKIPSSKLVRQDLMRPQEGHDHQHGGLTMALRSAMKDFVDIAVYFSLGVAITALFNTGVAPGREALNSLAGSPILGPAAMMGVAFFLSLCSTSDAFIAASLSHFTKGAKLAFMVFGPMFDLKLLFLYRSLFKTRVIIILGISLFIAIGALSILWAAFIPS